MMNANRVSAVTLFVSFYLAGYAVAVARASPTVAADGLYCSDRYGYRVQDGVEYMPEDDPCKKCQCQSGFPVMCRSVQCSPPTCSMYESLKNECCEFRCIQPSLDVPKNYGNGSNHIYPMLNANSVNLSIRLVASAVTSLLIFALLIFMIHRLRQRRLLISMRRLNNDRRSVNDGLAYMTNIDQLDIGFEFPPYEDPPPPYSPPKPTDDVPTEAPPPYELTSSQMEADDSIEIVHSDTNENGSGAGNATGERPLAQSAAMLLGNTRWMTDSHSLRPFSALEPFQSELIELSQSNLEPKSAMTLSSPVLTGQKRNQNASRCQPHAFTNNRRGGIFNGVQHSADSDAPTPSEITVNHSTSNHSALKHLKFDSSTSQLLLKMQSKLAHSSLLKHTTKAVAPSSSTSINRLDRMHTECPSDQHLFCQAVPSSERSTKSLKVFETMCDHSDPLNAGLVESEVEYDPSETRVKHLSSTNWEECRDGLMQRSAPEEDFSPHFKSSQVLCADTRKEKRTQSLMKTKDKSKTFLCNSSFLKKQEHLLRPRSGSGPDLGPKTKRSSLAEDLTGDQCSASTKLKKKKKTPEHPSSCLFLHLGHDEDDSSCIHEYSNAAKTQLHINERATILNEGNSLQPALTSNDQQSDFITTTRLEGLAGKQRVPENTSMSILGQSPRGIPSPAQVLLSPDSPIYQQFLRSESITSHASFYSICSETGEKKHTRSLLPKASKSLTVQDTMATGSDNLSPGNTSMITDLKEHSACSENMNSSGTGMEIADVDNYVTKDSLRNMKSSVISTSMAMLSLPVQGSHNHFMSGWKAKDDHSSTNECGPSTNKMKTENRSANNSSNLPVTLVDALSSKCLRELPHDRILECDILTGTKLSKAQSYAPKSNAESKEKPSPTNTELNSNASEAELSYQSCKVTLKPGQHDDDKGHLIFRDQLRQGVKDLVPSHKKHSCNRCKEHLNNVKKHKSKHMESFEYLVSRILQQLETSHFDDSSAHHNTGQKVQKPRRYGHQSDCCSTETGPALSAKGVACKQSRPFSLPNTRNSRFIVQGNINAELANLDLANRNNCILDPVENDNDSHCQQLRHGEYEAESRTDGCHSSGTPVSVGL